MTIVNVGQLIIPSAQHVHFLQVWVAISVLEMEPFSEACLPASVQPSQSLKKDQKFGKALERCAQERPGWAWRSG